MHTAAAAILPIEFRHGLSSGSGSSKEVEDDRVGAAGDGDKMLD